MTNDSVKEIGARLAGAFRLSARPLAVYGAESPPPDAWHLADVNRCLAVAMVRMATGAASLVGEPEVEGTHIAPPALYVTRDEPEGCCIGGLTHMGFAERPEYIRYFVSSGKADVRGGAAEYLKATPELVDAAEKAIGPVTPPGTYLVISTCDAVPEPDPGVRSICCFGTAEEIRNLAALVHFDHANPFSPVIVPWGPACATMVSYPAHMAAHTPPDSVFLGPQDPTVNHAIPPDWLVMGIPIDIARRMAANLERSFIGKRPKVAFPDRFAKTGGGR